PGVAAGLVRPGNAVKTPCLSARFRVESSDVSASLAATADTLHDFALHYQRSTRKGPTVGYICKRLVPDHTTCFDIERHHVQIRCAHEQLIAVERQVALHARPCALRQLSGVMPKFISVRCIQSLNVVVVAVDKD